MTVFVFITGGVVSSLGKGIVTASLGAMLKSEDYKVSLRKLDPYLNVDPGTMNPIQHGEVFVTEDGGEVDLDLGYYERFTGTIARKTDNITSGKIYLELLHRERRGDYLGATVQVVPHVTDLIKEFINANRSLYDFVLCEIGGTVGDIESQPFLEAIRQISKSNENTRSLFVHTTLVPYVSATNEMKTKPTQHSVKALMHHGITPDIIVCRVPRSLSKSDKHKISLFCNVREDCVIDAPDVKNIYEAPIVYYNNGLCEQILKLCNIPVKKQASEGLKLWHNFAHCMNNLQKHTTVAIVGKYTSSSDAYKSLIEAIVHAGAQLDTNVKVELISAQSLKQDNCAEAFKHISGIVIAGGFGSDGIDGKLAAIRYAREHSVPILGICLGMQLMVIEFCRNVLGIKNAHSAEFAAKSDDFVEIVTTMRCWTNNDGVTEYRSDKENLGGSMRLGIQKSVITNNTLAHKVYKTDVIAERHRHRYEIDIKYRDMVESKGMIISGISPDGQLPEIIEVQQYHDHNGNKVSHPFLLGCQFHPEFNSSPLKPHPLFVAFVETVNHSGK